MKAIVYSLFGYNKQRNHDCFDFNSYLRGLSLCLRFNRLIYPEWKTIVETDEVTYNHVYPYFKPLEETGALIVRINRGAYDLCGGMLWRLEPIFTGEYTHIICRDLDSPSVYREAQAVQQWVNADNKIVHAITDSISHNIPMLGGMIGFKCADFRNVMGVNSFKELMNLCNISLTIKGSDQTFINSVIYPKFSTKGSDSIMQHYFKGFSNTWLDGYRTCICWLHQPAMGHLMDCKLNTGLNIPDSMRESDECCQHIGSSGWNTTATDRFIGKYKDKFEDIKAAESNLKDVFMFNF